MSKLSVSIRAFLGNTEAAAELVGDALHSAILIAGQHGTRAPLDEAVLFVFSLPAKSAKEKALIRGMVACGFTHADAPNADHKAKAGIKGAALPGLKVGKMIADEAQALADDMSAAFVLALAEEVTAPKAPKKVDPSAVAQKALKALASLTDAQFAKYVRGSGEWADLQAVIARLDAAAAAAAAADAMKTAKRVAPSPAAPAVAAPAAPAAPAVNVTA